MWTGATRGKWYGSTDRNLLCSWRLTGPYFDKGGADLAQGGGTLLLATDGAFIGPGHAGIFEESDTFWFSCHFYDGTERGASKLAIRPLRWNPDGWPAVDAMNRK